MVIIDLLSTAPWADKLYRILSVVKMKDLPMLAYYDYVSWQMIALLGVLEIGIKILTNILTYFISLYVKYILLKHNIMS